MPEFGSHYLVIELPESVLLQLDAQAALQGVSLDRLVQNAVRELLVNLAEQIE